MSQHKLSSSILNATLMLIESATTLVLKFDPDLRKATYPLAKKNATVHLKTYLPHVQIYVTFTTKGIFLDANPPADMTFDVVVNTYTHQLLQAIVSNDMAQVNKINMRGDTETTAQLRLFLVQLGLASLFQGIIKTFKGNKSSKTADGKPESDTPKKDYKMLVEEQQQQLNALSIRNRELEISLQEAKSKQKTITIALIVAALITVAAVVAGLIDII